MAGQLQYQTYDPYTDPYFLLMLQQQQSAGAEGQQGQPQGAGNAAGAGGALASLYATDKLLSGGSAGAGEIAKSSVMASTAAPQPILPGASLAGAPATSTATAPVATSPSLASTTTATGSPVASTGAMLAGTAGVIATPIIGEMIARKFFGKGKTPGRPFLVDEAIQSDYLAQSLPGFDKASKGKKEDLVKRLHDFGVLYSPTGGKKVNGKIVSSNPKSPWMMRIPDPLSTEAIGSSLNPHGFFSASFLPNSNLTTEAKSALGNWNELSDRDRFNKVRTKLSPKYRDRLDQAFALADAELGVSNGRGQPGLPYGATQPVIDALAAIKSSQNKRRAVSSPFSGGSVGNG